MTVAFTSGSAAAGALAGATPARISPVQQWWVLTVRSLSKVARSGELIYSFLTPAMLAVCFYIPLRKVMSASATIDYAQFLMPIIMLQSMAFVASTAGMRASMDKALGVNARFRAMPMPAVVPFLARSVTNIVLLFVALDFGLFVCWLLGWRPIPIEEDGGGIGGVAIALLILIVYGILFSLLADALGMLATSPVATSQMVAFPTLILGMLSTGFIPLNLFPEWIQPFVRNQPISQITLTMREAMEGHLTWDMARATVWWAVGLLGAAIVLFALVSRRRSE